MPREYFNAYHSYIKAMETLTDAERGRLFMACLQYSMTGENQNFSGNERFVWPLMQSEIDRDVEKHNKFREKQAKNSMMRWHPMGCGGIFGNPKNAKLSQTIPMNKDEEVSKDLKTLRPKDLKTLRPKDLKTLRPKDTCANGICANGFEEFWAAYPKKRNKGDAEKAFKAIKPDNQMLGAMIDAISKQRLSRDWTKDNGQFIPYPATWLRARGWEDEEGAILQSEWRSL